MLKLTSDEASDDDGWRRWPDGCCPGQRGNALLTLSRDDFLVAGLAATKQRETVLRVPEAIKLVGEWPRQYTRTVLEMLLPKSATRVVVYLEPINVRWGARKLGALCRGVMHIEQDASTCFLFANRRRDTLLLYFLDCDGDQTVTKKMDKGSFLLPARDPDGAPFVNSAAIRVAAIVPLVTTTALARSRPYFA